MTMGENTFLLFLFGTTTLVFASLISVAYLIYLCVVTESEDAISTPANLPNNLKLDVQKFSQLQNFDRFAKLTDVEKITYLLSVGYCKFNKPNLIKNELNSNKVTTESLLIRDRGISSFYFQDYCNQIEDLVNRLKDESDSRETDAYHDVADETTALLQPQSGDLRDSFNKNKLLNLLKYYNYESLIPKHAPYIVEDLIEINFKSTKVGRISYSTILNLPIPTVNRKTNTIYFECKLLQFDQKSTLASIGLASNANYPNFQLPGYLPYSFAIESTGTLRMTTKRGGKEDTVAGADEYDNELVVLPQLNEGDVIGLGYRSISGSIFVTHNGKLIHEVIKGFKFQLYPCVGYKSLESNVSGNGKECKMSINLGQLGFVYIEANVKKLGFCENKNDGIIGAPPIYNQINLNNEILLDKGEDIPPKYPNEDSFFGPIVGTSSAVKEKKEDHEDLPESTAPAPVTKPPSYESEKKQTNELSEEEYENRISATKPTAELPASPTANPLATSPASSTTAGISSAGTSSASPSVSVPPSPSFPAAAAAAATGSTAPSALITTTTAAAAATGSTAPSPLITTTTAATSDIDIPVTSASTATTSSSQTRSNKKNKGKKKGKKKGRKSKPSSNVF